MRQKTYHIPNIDELEQTVLQIRQDGIIGSPDKSLLIVNEYTSDPVFVREGLLALHDGFPGVTTIGITMLGVLVDDIHMPCGMEVTAAAFDRSGMKVCLYDLSRTKAEDAAEHFSRELGKLQAVKGILCLPASHQTPVKNFIRSIAPQYRTLPLFGTPAAVYSKESGQAPAVFLGGTAYPEAVLCVVFFGEDLQIETGISLGYKPMGQQMTVTEGDGTGYVKTINHMTPAQLYERYFRLTDHAANHYEASSFPFLTEEDGFMAARIPQAMRKDAFFFEDHMPVGKKVTLSYGRVKNLLASSLALAGKMAEFGAEGMFCFACENRRVFLGDELEDRELDYFREVVPGVMISYGAGEILRSKGKGGFQNGSCVVAAFREGEKRKDIPMPSDPGIRRIRTPNPHLADMLVTFLEVTSQEMRFSAWHDTLTGIYNREAMEEILRKIGQRPLCVFMFDVDRFKDINDQYGHDVGDRVLKTVALISRENADRALMISRWGGDEFLCATTTMSGEELLENAEKIRGQIEKDPYLKDMGVTISGGIASAQHGSSFRRLYQKVDRALYHSKHYGGNKVSVYTDRYRREMTLSGKMYHFPPDVVRSVESSPYPMFYYQIIGDEYHILLISDGYCRMMGKDRKVVQTYLATHSMARVHPEDAARLRHAMMRMKDHKKSSMVYRHLIHGQYHHILCLGAQQVMDDGSMIIVSHLLDLDDTNALTRQAYSEYEKVRDEKHYQDELTGLPSISFFNVFADGRISEIRESGKIPTLFFFDVTGMHAYNDQFGYEAGNQLLQTVGRALSEFYPEDTVVRYSEDHFAVLTESKVDGNEAVRCINNRIMSLLPQGTASVKAGAYRCADPEESAVSCLDKARQALNMIGDDRSKVYCFYDRKVRAHYEEREYVISHFQEALDSGWIQVYYQPFYRTLTGRMCGSEALARWVDPERGTLSPASFITALEDTHLIHLLDLEIIRQVFEAESHFMKIGVLTQAISVNLSQVDFQTCDIFSEIESLRQRYQVPQGFLHIEITESALTSDPERLKTAIDRFHEAGYSVWMDDFGSGYSSLNVLKNYRFDWIKLDMSFLRDFSSNPASSVIIRSVVEMAKRLGIHTLCEGVETKDQYDFLRSIGCELAQGYLFLKPVPMDRMIAYVNKIGHERYEAHAENEYYEKIGLLDLMENSFRSSSEMNQADVLFEKDREGRLSLVYSSDEYNLQLKKLDVTRERLVKAANTEGSDLRNLLLDLMEKAKGGQTVRSLLHMKGLQQEIRLHYAAGDGSREMYAEQTVLLQEA